MWDVSWPSLPDYNVHPGAAPNAIPTVTLCPMGRGGVIGLPLPRHMHMALFRAGPRAGCAADAVLRPGDGHDLVAHVVAVFVLTGKWLFNELQHVETADLVAATAADALFDLDLIDEFRRPGPAAPGRTGNG